MSISNEAIWSTGAKIFGGVIAIVGIMRYRDRYIKPKKNEISKVDIPDISELDYYKLEHPDGDVADYIIAGGDVDEVKATVPGIHIATY